MTMIAMSCRTVLVLLLCMAILSPGMANHGDDYESVLADVRQRTDDLHADGDNRYPHFYPIGFSPQGEFAYALTDAHCRCTELKCESVFPFSGAYKACDPKRFVHVILVNLVTDDWRSLTPVEAEEFIRKHNVMQQDAAVHAFPLDVGTDRYAATAEGRVNVGGECGDSRDRSTVDYPCVIVGLLESGERGRKVFYHYDPANAEGELGQYSDFHVVGYLRSPCEQRIAIVMTFSSLAEISRVPAYVVSGANLRRGFERM